MACSEFALVSAFTGVDLFFVAAFGCGKALFVLFSDVDAEGVGLEEMTFFERITLLLPSVVVLAAGAFVEVAGDETAALG